EASQAFGVVMDKVLYNLDLADKFIHRNVHYDLISENEVKKFEGSFLQIKKLRREEIENSDLSPEERIRRLEESQLIIDQLIWMINISEQILNTSKKFGN